MRDIGKDEIKILPFSFEIERGKIKEFAMAIGDKNPLYYDIMAAREQGYRDIPVPPTFPTVIDMWGGLDFETIIDRLGLDPLKVLHGGQEYRYMADICAGDTVTAYPELTSAFEKRNLRFFVIDAVYENSDGKQVLSSKSTIIERY